MESQSGLYLAPIDKAIVLKLARSGFWIPLITRTTSSNKRMNGFCILLTLSFFGCCCGDSAGFLLRESLDVLSFTRFIESDAFLGVRCFLSSVLFLVGCFDGVSLCFGLIS